MERWVKGDGDKMEGGKVGLRSMEWEYEKKEQGGKEVEIRMKRKEEGREGRGEKEWKIWEGRGEGERWEGRKESGKEGEGKERKGGGKDTREIWGCYVTAFEDEKERTAS